MVSDAGGASPAPFDPAIAHYAVIGHPVAHSKSPLIHAAFAATHQQAMQYDRIDAAPGDFATTVRQFIAQGGRGLNVTVPFKLEACALADTLTERAAAAGAVNTLHFVRDAGTKAVTIIGDNTDGAGLVRDLEQNQGCAIAGKRVLLLGAGGAARGVILPLLARRPACLDIMNRTPARAVELQAQFAAAAALAGCPVSVPEPAAPVAPYDIVINATAGSLSGALPAIAPGAIGPQTHAYDMMYGAAPTVFMRYATEQGAQAHDGLGMLVEQAAESFALWRGVHPAGGPVLQQLRAGLQAQAHV